jgi:hypothetical protein
MNPGVVVVLVVLAIVVVVAIGLTRPVNLTLTVADGRLIVQPRGLDVLWTLCRRIEIPLDRVTDVRVVSRADAPRPLLRVPGTYVHGVITAGSFGTGEDRTFWDVRRGDPVLVIGCADGAPYRALVVEFAEPYSVLARVRGALGD